MTNVKTRVNFSFFVKRHNALKNGELPIYMKITANGTYKNISTGQSTPAKKWISKAGKVEGNSTKVKAVNRALEKFKNEFEDIYTTLTESRKPITPMSIIAAFHGQTTEVTLMELFHEHNINMHSLIGKKFTESTYRKYDFALRHVQNYLNYLHRNDKSYYGVLKTNTINDESCVDITISDINHKFITDFEQYMIEVRSCAHNTIVRYIKQVKKIVNIALNREIINDDPFRRFRIGYKKTHKDFLTQDELDKLINKQFKNDRLQIVKDCFLFSCFSGLSHIDLYNLRPQNIVLGTDGEKWISMHRQKTGTASNIPLLPIPERIIEKYQFHPRCTENDKLLPVFSVQKVNAYLQEIADTCGIEKHLTSHVARHTFATTVTLSNNVPIESVSKMLGHTDIRTTKIYARLLNERIANDMKVVKEKYSC